MEYVNIKKDLSFEIGTDAKYHRKELINNVVLEFKKGNIELINIQDLESSQISISVILDKKNYEFITLLKNITGAGWKEKPKIKRVQVSNIKRNSLIRENNNVFYLIIGYYNYDDNPIWVCWDAYRYLHHKTIRSCYVSVDSLKVGYIRGFYEGVDSSQKLWIFKGENFEKFFQSYIDYNLRMKR